MRDHLAAVVGRWNWAAVVWAVCVPLTGVYVWARHILRRGSPVWTVRTGILEALILLADLPALLVMLTPGDEFSSGLQLLPLENLSELRGASGADATAQILGNLGAFAVVGALLPLRWPLTLLDVALAVALAVGSLSVVVEMVQYSALGRVAATDDVLLNVVGALVGALVTRRWWMARRVSTITGN